MACRASPVRDESVPWLTERPSDHKRPLLVRGRSLSFNKPLSELLSSSVLASLQHRLATRDSVRSWSEGGINKAGRNILAMLELIMAEAVEWPRVLLCTAASRLRMRTMVKVHPLLGRRLYTMIIVPECYLSVGMCQERQTFEFLDLYSAWTVQQIWQYSY